MREHDVVVVAQDTTELDYTRHAQVDAKCLNHAHRKGLYQHTHLALTVDGVPLGVVGQSYFARDAQDLGNSEQRNTLPIEEKESVRWLNGYRLATELARDRPETTVVSVADREADIYDIFREARDHASEVRFVIRARLPRCTTERDPETTGATYLKV